MPKNMSNITYYDKDGNLQEVASGGGRGAELVFQTTIHSTTSTTSKTYIGNELVEGIQVGDIVSIAMFLINTYQDERTLFYSAMFEVQSMQYTGQAVARHNLGAIPFSGYYSAYDLIDCAFIGIAPIPSSDKQEIFVNVKAWNFVDKWNDRYAYQVDTVFNIYRVTS